MRNHRSFPVAAGVSLLLVLSNQPSRAREIRVVPGFGVDTLASPRREIYSLWRGYLTSRPESLRSNPRWSAGEQSRWPDFDLLRTYVYQGFTAFTIVQLAPAAGLDSTYLLRTLVSAVDDSTHDVRPLALYRTYAVREEGRWVLANALPRDTRDWSHASVGRLRYVVRPGRVLDAARSRRAAAFVDSLAAAFGVAAPESITCVVANDLLEAHRAIGLEFFPSAADTAGGRANVADRMVLVGSTMHGEDYLHELAHVVLAPVVGPRCARAVSEGLATWCGGSATVDFADLLPGLRRYVSAHPELTLRSLLEDPPQREGSLDVLYDGFAVLCRMIHARRGTDGIRDLARAGRSNDEVLRAAARLLGVPLDQLDAAWRAEVLSSPKQPARH